MKYACICCGYITMNAPPSDSYDICPVCFREDDGAQVRDPRMTGGANGVSLIEARLNYAAFGAAERRVVQFVREPRPEEQPVR